MLLCIVLEIVLFKALDMFLLKCVESLQEVLCKGISNAQTVTSGLVHIGWSNSLECGANLSLAHCAL